MRINKLSVNNKTSNFCSKIQPYSFQIQIKLFVQAGPLENVHRVDLQMFERSECSLTIDTSSD